MGDSVEVPLDFEGVLDRLVLVLDGAVEGALEAVACRGVTGVDCVGVSAEGVVSAIFSDGLSSGFSWLPRAGSGGSWGEGVAGSGSEPKSQGVES